MSVINNCIFGSLKKKLQIEILFLVKEVIILKGPQNSDALRSRQQKPISELIRHNTIGIRER